ncbi:protocadherin Fat 4-like isoform X2 [Thalassophryne amazonica]|uniref:protocadherin Fat 4-like isoform X2 n=1 Tax=Thalassophryne amazonica TaxID=390379 RepID=UPI001471539F|nr:protocadherin Fat 4-like isoform X2 [Thalassophryne amazonica]
MDFDNQNPYFSYNLYHTSIPENQEGFLTTQPEAIKAQDGDLGINMSVIYSLGAVFPDVYEKNFNVNAISGVLSVTTKIDRDLMNSSVILVTIKAAQTDDITKTTQALVNVMIEDVNDNPPEFEQSQYSVTIPENSPVDSILLKVIITDLDLGGFVGNLTILPESAPFAISDDGTVRVTNTTALDREATDTITFQIEANETSPPHHFTTADVRVRLLDENDNSPTFTSTKYEGSVFANQTEGMFLLQVKAEDPDADENGRIKYSIDFWNTDSYFAIDENTGNITLIKPIQMGENKIQMFTFYVTATDGGVAPRSSSVQVDIRAPGNSNPQFLQKRYIGTIEEEQNPGTLVLQVKFQAVASEDLMLHVNTQNDLFNISSSGEFITKKKLDYDEGPHNYSVDISISDGVNSDTAVVEVQVTDINDNSPVFESSNMTTVIPENLKIRSNVTVVGATDKDSSFNGEIRYSLRGGEGRFSVDPVSAVVHVAAELDRETKAEYSLLVVAEDQGRPVRSATASLQVRLADVNDNKPVFSQTEYQAEVLETEPLDTFVLNVSAVDPDEGANGTVTYSILQQTPPSDLPVFVVNSSTGTLLLDQPLDYSRVNGYTLMVQATDGGTPLLVGKCSVVVKVKDVNNNPPHFSQERYNVAVPENLPSGASILTLEVTDRDEGGFSNGFFVYTSDTFDISKQGVVSLKDVTLDRETKDSYILQVVAVDQVSDGLNATAQLNVTVLDYNDNTPQFPVLPDSLPISEGNYSETPSEIYTIVPTDADLGPNGEVTISLASPHPLFRFTKNGTLLAVGVLDRESRDTYDLIIQAVDRGVPQRENFTTIRVNVTDVNDNRPQFNASSYVSSILLKDAKEGKLLLTLCATDKDIGDNAAIAYSFIAGNTPYLALDAETGAVTLTSNFTEVTKDTTLVLTAMAEDGGQPPLNSTAQVVVNLKIASLVEGVAFLSPSYNLSVPENQPAGAMVGRVTASSGSDLYDVRYSLKTYTDLFSINTSGAIQTKTQLNKESQEWYILEVKAVDTRIPPTSAVATVKVQVEDMNEAPQFIPDSYTASIFSIAPYKTPVVQVQASDPDVGDETRLKYSLIKNTNFDVETSSGQVYVVSVSSLAGTEVTLEVMVSDPKGKQATATVEVTVKGSASSDDVVTISLNQPANDVEKKLSEVEMSLSTALGWTVNIIEVSATIRETVQSRMSTAISLTLVSFIAFDGGQVVSPQDITKKLQDQSALVKQELEKIFGEGLQYDIVKKTTSPASDQTTVIALSVMLALSMLGLFIIAFLIIWFRRKNRFMKELDGQSLYINRDTEGSTNWEQRIPENPKKVTPPSHKKAETGVKETNKTLQTDSGTEDRRSCSTDSCTSTV